LPAADITDWNYMRNGKYAGMFTMKRLKGVDMAAPRSVSFYHEMACEPERLPRYTNGPFV